MYGYIYLTTNIVNNKRYIGQHRSKTFDKNYIGSGVLLLKAVEKYGRENFTTILLEECSTDKELNEREVYHIAKYDATNSDDFYNIARGGEGHTCEPWNKGKKGVQRTTQKQLDALKAGRELPASNKLKQQLSERRRGIIVSEETRKKLREKAKSQQVRLTGRVWIYGASTDTYKRVKPEELDSFLNEGWICQGPKQNRSAESIDKYKNASLGRRHIHKGTQNKNVRADEYASYIADGWEDGYVYKN